MSDAEEFVMPAFEIRMALHSEILPNAYYILPNLFILSQVQQELAGTLADLIFCFSTTSSAVLFVKCFFATIVR